MRGLHITGASGSGTTTLSWRRRIRVALLLLAVGGALSIAAGAALLWSDDPLSAEGRRYVEWGLNGYLKGMRLRAADDGLTTIDRAVLHTGILVGTGIGGLFYPEGAQVLRHSVYGRGADLELDASYFSRSPYVAARVQELGNGDHGPLWIDQKDDWRLSLALNPYYLRVTDDKVRLYHPTMKWTEAKGPPVFTVVPVGKMRIHVWDNLVSALGTTQFLAYSEWER